MSEDDPDEKLEEMRQESVSGGGNRLQSDGDGSSASFVEHVMQALNDVDEGEIPKSISFWDPKLAALLAALEEDDERRDQIVAGLQEELGREVDTESTDRSTVLRLAVRLGLQEVDENLFEEAAEAQSQRVRDETF